MPQITGPLSPHCTQRSQLEYLRRPHTELCSHCLSTTCQSSSQSSRVPRGHTAHHSETPSIAHHKSYHPYKADNIERVRRDEERAAAIEAGDRARVMQADSEARIALLRKKSKKGKSKEEDTAEKALDRQLKGRGRAGEVDETKADPELHRQANEHLASITTKDGHCKEALFSPYCDAEHYVQSTFGQILKLERCPRHPRPIQGGRPMPNTKPKRRRNRTNGMPKSLCI